MNLMKTLMVLTITLGLGSAAHASSEAESVAQEINTNSISTESRKEDMASIYQSRIHSFNNSLSNSAFSASQKKMIGRNFLNYAQIEINSQTEGSGISYHLLMYWHQAVSNAVSEGRFSDAKDIVNTYAGNVLNLLN
jgi:hypothetical protein